MVNTIQRRFFFAFSYIQKLSSWSSHVCLYILYIYNINITFFSERYVKRWFFVFFVCVNGEEGEEEINWEKIFILNVSRVRTGCEMYLVCVCVCRKKIYSVTTFSVQLFFVPCCYSCTFFLFCCCCWCWYWVKSTSSTLSWINK